jgi:hypothetical protein
MLVFRQWANVIFIPQAFEVRATPALAPARDHCGEMDYGSRVAMTGMTDPIGQKDHAEYSVVIYSVRSTTSYAAANRSPKVLRSKFEGVGNLDKPDWE